METTGKIKKNLDLLHFEHKRWDKQLRFYGDELKIFRNRIEEIVQRYTDKEVLAQLEHFQNHFFLQKEVIDTLADNINIHEDELMHEAKKKITKAEHKLFDDHSELRDKIETFVKQNNQLKNDYMRYINKCMQSIE